jgi:hypothetical protein
VSIPRIFTVCIAMVRTVARAAKAGKKKGVPSARIPAGGRMSRGKRALDSDLSGLY